MNVHEHYTQAKEHGYHSLVLLIEYLVNEKKVISMGDSEEKLTYYLQEKFWKKMNEYLSDYKGVGKRAI
jgi:hypothetical protein